MKIRHFPWAHFSLPPQIKKLNDVMTTYTFKFIQPVYDVGVEQEDWNKLTGVKENYFKPKDHSLMVGWRWNPKTELVELCFYKHDRGGRDFTKPLLFLKKGEEVKVIYYRKEAWWGKDYVVSIAANKQVHTQTISMDGYGWLINSWFGGTSKPDRTIVIEQNG